jgi:hypothetical protein
MAKRLVRRIVLGLFGLFIFVCVGASVVLVRIKAKPNTRVEFLPPKDWFSHGVAGDGVDTVTITEVYGPIAITTKHRR